jgi:translation initiation factor 5B
VQGLNVELYWKNKDPRRYVNIVPTSAITGEGVCDLMWLIVKLTQSMMADRLMFVEEMQCTVLEVKMVEGYGTTIDVVLVNGNLREGDRIVACGLDGPIVTSIRSLLTPHPMKELRVKNTYLHFKEIKAAQGIKISAPGLEKAVAGTVIIYCCASA